MHTADFLMIGGSLAAAAYPLVCLRQHWQQPGVPFLFALVLVCGLYPLGYPLAWYSPLDTGVVYAFTSFIGPLYCLATLDYLGIRIPGKRMFRRALLTLTAVLSAVALTNAWHGLYADFAPLQPGIPLNLQTALKPQPGLLIMENLSYLLILMTASTAFVHFARARIHLPQLLVMLIFPVLAGVEHATSQQGGLLDKLGMNGFVLVTTTGLGILTYSLSRRHFIQVRPIARDLLIKLIPDGMVVVSPEGTIIDCNDTFAAFWRRQAGDLISSPLTDYLPATAWTPGPAQEAQRDLCLDLPGGVRHFDLRITPMRASPRSDLQMLLLRDITAQKSAHEALAASQAKLRAANAELERLSTTDALTGLKNRRYFLERLEEEIGRSARSGLPFGLLAIDLDHFKRINDLHGHSAGDQVLTAVSRVMEGQCRAVDTLARFGGEEFMVLLHNVNQQQLQQAAERFRTAISRVDVQLAGRHAITVTGSVGALLGGAGTTVESLMHSVDELLYRAKDSGRNRTAI